MIAILRLELRRQTPFALFLLGFVLISVGFTAATELPFEISMGHELEKPESDDTFYNTMVYSVLTLALASSIFMRQFDDGTIEWLDALPTSRGAMFWAKTLAGLAILGILPVSGVLYNLVTEWLSLDSLNPQFDVAFHIFGNLVEWIIVAILFGYSALLARARAYSWFLLAAVLIALYLLLQEFPTWSTLDPRVAAGTVNAFDGRLTVNFRALGAHVGASAACLVLSSFLFASSSSRASQGGTVWPSGFRVLIRRGASAVLVLMAIVVAAAWGDGALGPQAPERRERRSGVAREKRAGFHASYPTRLRRRATELLDATPRIRQRVSGFFGTPLDFDIRLDMTGSRRHTAGTASWKLVQMNLDASSDGSVLSAILGHELAHVAMAVMTDGRLRDRLFHEGVASYVEAKLFRAGDHRNAWLESATIREWHKLDFDQVVDETRLAKRWDGNVVYPLGETFFATLARDRGDAVVPKLLRQLKENRDLQATSGMAFWRALFARADVPLSAAISAWHHQLTQLRFEQKFISERAPTGVSQTHNGFFYVTPQFAAPRGWSLRCRVRPPGADDLSYIELQLHEGRRDFFAIAASSLPSGACQYQLGFFRPGTGVWGEWVDVQISTE
ncbi:MAG: hypothetical protein AAF517_02040 [Planctomycetota bacterium]